MRCWALVKGLEREWQDFRIVDISQKGCPIKTVDNWKNILLHVEGKDCVSITPVQPACQPQQLEVNWIRGYRGTV